MEKKKVVIIGVGGRTGTMFSFELSNSADVLGVARAREARAVEEKRVYVERGGKSFDLFKVRTIKDNEFRKSLKPDIIFLTTKNPVSIPIRYYLKDFENEIPTLLISQNGISALLDSKEALKDMFGKESNRVRIVRVVLFNPIDKRESEGKLYIKYSLPLSIALAKSSGEGDIKDIIEMFRSAGFKVKEFFQEDAGNLEFSKLFLNLIGMASASRGLSIEEGFSEEEVFKEEVGAIKEYVRAVKLSGGSFLNLPGYPVKTFADLISFIPLFFLMFFRRFLIRKITGGREGKPKDLDEIDYYNGAVVSLGKKIGMKTPVNERIHKRAKDRLK